MTMPDPAEPRKPANRFWLYALYAVVLIAMGGWSLAWLEIGHQVSQRLDQAAAGAKAGGQVLTWSGRHVGGYPFRIEVTLEQPAIGEPSGWSVSAPRIKAIANAYDLNHWVIVAPQGVVLTRPSAGASTITGEVLRASWVNEGEDAPRIVVEGLNLSFVPQPGARPFPLAKASRAVFYTRTLAGDQTEARLFLSGAWAEPSGRLAMVTGQNPMSLMWQGTVSHLSAFRGADASAAARAWASAGGTLTTSLGGAAAGGRTLGVAASRVSSDANGRLAGDISVQLKGGGAAIRALGDCHMLDPAAASLAAAMLDARADKDGRSRVDLFFQDGATWIGLIRLGPAPKPF